VGKIEQPTQQGKKKSYDSPIYFSQQPKGGKGKESYKNTFPASSEKRKNGNGEGGGAFRRKGGMK